MRRSLLTLVCGFVLLGGQARVWAEKKEPVVTVVKDLTYGKGGDVDLKLDLAFPKEGKGPFAAIICVHGGGWRGGKRQDLSNRWQPLGDRSLIEVLAGRGFVAATVSYRLTPKNKFPAQIEDCKAAVRWLRANAGKFRIDADRIGAIGFSAGGHLVCLLGTSTKKDGFEGKGGNPDQSSRVQAVVSFFGPTNFITKDWTEEVEKVFLIPLLGATYKDKPELYKWVSPISYVSRGAPPFLFYHGTEDTLVGPRHSRELAAKLKDAGTSARVVEMKGEAHGWGGKKLLESLDGTLAFFDETLKAGKAKK